MEIQKDLYLSQLELIKSTSLGIKDKAYEEANKFEALLKNEEVNRIEKVKTLEQWIKSLEEIKLKLETDITKVNLDTYKESVKRFLDYYVENDLYLKEHRTQDGLFYSKKIQVLKSVDDKVDELTDKLMKTQAGRLEILHLTGQIQGLLFELII